MHQKVVKKELYSKNEILLKVIQGIVLNSLTVIAICTQNRNICLTFVHRRMFDKFQINQKEKLQFVFLLSTSTALHHITCKWITCVAFKLKISAQLILHIITFFSKINVIKIFLFFNSNLLYNDTKIQD